MAPQRIQDELCLPDRRLRLLRIQSFFYRWHLEQLGNQIHATLHLLTPRDKTLDHVFRFENRAVLMQLA